MTEVTFNDYEADVWGDLESADKRTRALFWIAENITERQRIGISFLVLRRLVKVDRTIETPIGDGETSRDWKIEFTREGRDLSKRINAG